MRPIKPTELGICFQTSGIWTHYTLCYGGKLICSKKIKCIAALSVSGVQMWVGECAVSPVPAVPTPGHCADSSRAVDRTGAASAGQLGAFTLTVGRAFLLTEDLDPVSGSPTGRLWHVHGRGLAGGTLGERAVLAGWPLPLTVPIPYVLWMKMQLVSARISLASSGSSCLGLETQPITRRQLLCSPSCCH